MFHTEEPHESDLIYSASLKAVRSLESSSNNLPVAISAYFFKNGIELPVQEIPFILPMQKEDWQFKYTYSLSHPYSGAYIVHEPLWCLWNALGTMEKQAKYIHFFTYSQFNYETLNSKSQTQTIANLLFHLSSSVPIMLAINSSHSVFHNTTPQQYSLER